MGKRVLIIGNGFDLAHGLPTRYSNFLDFCYGVLNNPFNLFVGAWLNTYIKGKNIKNKCNVFFCNHSDSFIDSLNENVWFVFLYDQYEKKLIKNENWIDFESEISSIIQLIDKKAENLLYEFEITKYYSENNINQDDLLLRFLNKYIKIKKTKSKYSKERIFKVKIKELRSELNDDLDKLIKALELYLLLVENIPINLKSKDISGFKYNYIINFNYTHTYQKVYDNCEEIFHVHGESKHEPNNMVLGIDEYWSENERDSHTNFTIFKKFAQRIQKRTGVFNYKWFDEIKSDYEKNNETAEVFIFGHSLDITDKDILYNYLESEATNVTIYCKDKETEGEYIEKVIKIIGEKRLLEKVNQYPSKLNFIIQQDMIPIEEEENELSTSGAAT